MLKEIHGGNIYDKEVRLDFSVNINPFGMPENVKKAVAEHISKDSLYPDIFCTDLRNAIADKECVKAEQVICGNGASELIMAAVRAVKPSECAVAAPSFSGYERAVRAYGAVPVFYELSENSGYGYEKAAEQILSKPVQMCFLCNPNNPTGNLIPNSVLTEILDGCADKNVTVVLDECFLKFHPQYEKISGRQLIEKYDNLLVLNAFTKFYAMAGIRLGYIIMSDLGLRDKIIMQLPEWNVSSAAQRAGIAALKEDEYEKETKKFVEKERLYLSAEFKKAGCKVYPSEADYITFCLPKEKQDILLKEELLKKKILIRSCENYKNMLPGSYRIAVKKHEENKELIKQVRQILKEQ